MRLAARRFPDRIIRRREMPGRRNDIGEWVPGAVESVELRANVQPLALTDSELAGGTQLTHRLKAFVLPRQEPVGFGLAALLFNGDPLTLHGEPLTLGLGSKLVDVQALAAILEEAGADRVEWKGVIYVVEESRTWPAFTRATLLRET